MAYDLPVIDVNDRHVMNHRPVIQIDPRHVHLPHLVRSIGTASHPRLSLTLTTTDSFLAQACLSQDALQPFVIYDQAPLLQHRPPASVTKTPVPRLPGKLFPDVSRTAPSDGSLSGLAAASRERRRSYSLLRGTPTVPATSAQLKPRPTSSNAAALSSRGPAFRRVPPFFLTARSAATSCPGPSPTL